MTSELVITVPISEADFQKLVIDYAHLRGWRVAHFRPAMLRAQGWNNKAVWATPVQADGAGFPDLVMVRDGELVIAELKSEKGKVSDEQRPWLLQLGWVKGIKVYIWRPSQWDEIEKVLE